MDTSIIPEILSIVCILIYWLFTFFYFKKQSKVKNQLIEHQEGIYVMSIMEFYRYQDHYRLLRLYTQGVSPTDEFRELQKQRDQHLQKQQLKEAQEVNEYIEKYIQMKLN